MPRKTVAEHLEPAVMGLAKAHAGHRIQRLLGFWMCWHYWGGLEALIASGHFSKSAVYRQREEFREVFSQDVEDCYPHTAAAWREELGRRHHAGFYDSRSDL